MPEIEVQLPDHIDAEIDRLVDQGEFLNREQAMEELLSLGASAYDVEEDDDGIEDDPYMQTGGDQGDPALRDDNPGDERTF